MGTSRITGSIGGDESEVSIGTFLRETLQGFDPGVVAGIDIQFLFQGFEEAKPGKILT